MPDDDNLIVLDTEDLPEVDTPEKIVIELDDLDDDEIYPGMPSDSADFTPTVKAGGNPIIRSNLLQNILAGAIGGLLAWLVTEMFYDDYSNAQSIEQIIMEMALFGGAIGGLMGSALGAAEGVITRVAPVALRGGAIALGVGFLGGMVGGASGQILYGTMGGGTFEISMGMQVLARTLAWGLVGMFIGLGQGISFRSSKKIVNGLIGGMAGGLVGGLLFDLIGSVTVGGGTSRSIAITLMGAAVGAAIGMVDEIRKEAWLKVIAGPMTGKEYILFNEVTHVGSSPKCDIVIYRDPQVAPQQAIIEGKHGHYRIVNNGTATPVYVNDRSVSASALANGQSIRMGSTVFLFQVKESNRSF
jgi:hypothetical protein